MRTSALEWVQKFAYDLWTQMNKSFEKEHQGYPYISDLLLLSSEFHSISLIKAWIFALQRNQRND